MTVYIRYSTIQMFTRCTGHMDTFSDLIKHFNMSSSFHTFPLLLVLTRLICLLLPNKYNFKPDYYCAHTLVMTSPRSCHGYLWALLLS